MKRPTPRPAAALVLTATAIFTLLGNRCGLLGQLLTACLAKLLGVPGTVLFECTLLAVAFVLAFPGRLGQLVNRTPRPVKTETVNTTLDLHERRRLNDVRGALKQLGYVRTEYEPLIEKMDPSCTPDVLLREAIQTLTKSKKGTLPC